MSVCIRSHTTTYQQNPPTELQVRSSYSFLIKIIVDAPYEVIVEEKQMHLGKKRHTLHFLPEQRIFIANGRSEIAVEGSNQSLRKG